jgi:hypothetical protein
MRPLKKGKKKNRGDPQAHSPRATIGCRQLRCSARAGRACVLHWSSGTECSCPIGSIYSKDQAIQPRITPLWR